jgi:hypothetical protein
VHVIGHASAQSPLEDGDLNNEFPGQLAVKRAVEMYQWREKKESASQNNLGAAKPA